MTMMETQVYNDNELLKFKTYEEYLDSLTIPQDLFYLRSIKFARQIAELGYRCKGKTLSKTAFYKRLETVKNEFQNPKQKPFILFSELIIPKNSLQLELAIRERENRLKIITTIIFLRYRIKSGFEISGFIDYSHRLETDDWLLFFQGKTKLRVRTTDLSYFNWKKDYIIFNNTPNYQAVIKPKQLLVFKNIHDENIINVDPYLPSPGNRTTRKSVMNCEDYENIILFDHKHRNISSCIIDEDNKSRRSYLEDDSSLHSLLSLACED